jgi:hypothetical protein
MIDEKRKAAEAFAKKLLADCASATKAEEMMAIVSKCRTHLNRLREAYADVFFRCYREIAMRYHMLLMMQCGLPNDAKPSAFYHCDDPKCPR